MHLLDRDERVRLVKDLKTLKPEFIKPFIPGLQFAPCVINVLIVCDGALNFHAGDFGLSEFLTTFNKLESLSNVDYRVTIAHRGNVNAVPNPVVVNSISSFKFDTSVNLKNFDQVWLFAINTGGAITAAEVNAIEKYMNEGGGLFATGDHGFLGAAMCGNIPRVKDMRYWSDTPAGSNNNTNEVSMAGRRRNDTNVPRPGNSIANTFDHQSDSHPQTIAVRTFGGGKPHFLLSISTNIRPSGIIDIMPDHPHEGECKPQTSFTVNGMSIATQIIATSFVTGGNTSGGKDATDPHCFPSISVFDGRPANVGRIVIDSTWHHFVNINLNGAGSAQSGLTAGQFEVIQQYYMNISTWMTRRKVMLCLAKQAMVDLLKNSQLVEATLNNPDQKLEEISLTDLNSIGALAEEILGDRFNPVFAREFFLELFEDYSVEFADMMNPWKNDAVRGRALKPTDYHENWINLDLILRTSIGAGFIALRDDKEVGADEVREKSLDKVPEVFKKGMDFGFNAATQNLNSDITRFTKTLKTFNELKKK